MKIISRFFNKKISGTTIIFIFIVIGTALYSPFINNNFTYDDFLFVSLIEEKIPVNPFLGFWAVDMKDTKIFETMWWIDEDAEGRFFRPLPTLVFTAMFKIWGRNSALYLHLFSIIMHCINAFLVYVTLEKLSKKHTISLAAGFIYLICVHHVLSVGWISTNTDLMAVFFMLLSIYSYIIYREKNNISALFVSLLMQLLAFGCKETASITTAAIILYELIFIPRKASAGTIKTFLLNWNKWMPGLTLTVFFLLFYKLGGFGINSLLYYDPFLKPGLFINNLFIGYPLMFLGLLSLAPFSFPVFMPELLVPFVIMGLVISIFFFIALFPYRKDKALIFCFFLFIISILPQLSADATERQLYFPYTAGSFMISFLIFQIPFLKKRFSPDTPQANKFIGKTFSYYLLLSSVIVTFILMLYYPYSYSSSAVRPEDNTRKVKVLADKKHADKIFMLNIPGSLNLLYMNDIYRFQAGGYADFNILYGGDGKLWLNKISDSTILLKTDKKGWLTNMLARLPRTNPLIEKNTTFTKNNFFAKIIETTPDKQDVLEVEFKFNNSLNVPNYIFLYFDGNEIKEMNFKQINGNEWILIGDTSDILKIMI